MQRVFNDCCWQSGAEERLQPGSSVVTISLERLFEAGDDLVNTVIKRGFEAGDGRFLLYSLFRSSRPDVFCKKLFLEISQTSQEKTRPGLQLY